MRRIDRYMLKELVVPLVIGTIAVVLMFQINLLIGFFKNLDLQPVPWTAVFQAIVYHTPEYLGMTLPVGTALATSLSIARLTRESELTGMRAAGIPILRIVAPFMLIGVVLAVANFVVLESLMPPAKREARRLLAEIGMKAAAPRIMPNVTVRLRNATVFVGLVQKTPSGVVDLQDILVVERQQLGQATIIFAESGSYSDGEWKLKGTVTYRLAGTLLEAFEPRDEVTINERVEIERLMQGETHDEMSLRDLKKAIEAGRQQGRDVLLQEVRYHTRFSIPAACIVFAIIGPVFAIRMARAGMFVGVLLSIILVIIYYNAFVISTEIISRYQWAPPVISAWLPNLVFLVLGLVGLRSLE